MSDRQPGVSIGAGNWEHAEYAWDLLRHDRYVEIEPNFLMAAVNESSDDDPLAKDLLRKLMIFYVTFSPDGHATIWVGKHVTFQRSVAKMKKW